MRALLKLAFILLFLVGCAPRIAQKARPREIGVCVHPPPVPPGYSRWAFSRSGKLSWEPWEVELLTGEDNPVFVDDPNADEESVKWLPRPYNELKCAARVQSAKADVAVAREEPKKKDGDAAPPIATGEDAMARTHTWTRTKTWTRTRTRTKVAVKQAAPPEALCSAEPGQVRGGRAGTGDGCRRVAKVTLAPSRSVDKVDAVTDDATPKPIEPPQPGPIEDWNVGQPDVTGLAVGRAIECLGSLCHARHPGFNPKNKNGSGKGTGQSSSNEKKRYDSGKKAGGRRDDADFERGPGGARKHKPGKGHDRKSAPQDEKKKNKAAAKEKQEKIGKFKAAVDEWNGMPELAKRLNPTKHPEAVRTRLKLKLEDVKHLRD